MGKFCDKETALRQMAVIVVCSKDCDGVLICSSIDSLSLLDAQCGIECDIADTLHVRIKALIPFWSLGSNNFSKTNEVEKCLSYCSIH